jgi:hypothetical protein
VPAEEYGARITEIIFSGQVRTLRDGVTDYLQHKDMVWLLIDDLDKGWPIQGADSIDILLIRSLLEATRKLQQMIEGDGIEFRCLVFLRSDIYDRLLVETPDKGKDTAIQLQWDDVATFERIVERRILASTHLKGDFRTSLWPAFCDPLVGARSSFDYIIDRTLMRPRDLLLFLHRAIEAAINRGQSRITEETIQIAEDRYSNDILRNMQYEISDTNPGMAGVLDAFAGGSSLLSVEDALLALEILAGLEKEGDAKAGLRLLLWYGFLGVRSNQEDHYAYSYAGEFGRLVDMALGGKGSLVIHPAFRAALRTDSKG